MTRPVLRLGWRCAAAPRLRCGWGWASKRCPLGSPVAAGTITTVWPRPSPDRFARALGCNGARSHPTAGPAQRQSPETQSPAVSASVSAKQAAGGDELGELQPVSPRPNVAISVSDAKEVSAHQNNLGCSETSAKLFNPPPGLFRASRLRSAGPGAIPVVEDGLDPTVCRRRRRHWRE